MQNHYTGKILRTHKYPIGPQGSRSLHRLHSYKNCGLLCECRAWILYLLCSTFSRYAEKIEVRIPVTKPRLTFVIPQRSQSLIPPFFLGEKPESSYGNIFGCKGNFFLVTKLSLTYEQIFFLGTRFFFQFLI